MWRPARTNDALPVAASHTRWKCWNLQEWSNKPADMGLVVSVAGLFKWRQFEPEVILLAVRWYLRFSLSYRDVEELLAERGLRADQRHHLEVGSALRPGRVNRRLRSRLKLTNDSWRVDETYIRVKGKWVYLYRAVDSTGATIDFLLSAKRDTVAAKRFLVQRVGEVLTIRTLGSSTPTRTRLTRQPSYNSKPRVLWRRTVDIDRGTSSTMFWNRIIGRSNAGCVQASIFAPSGVRGARSPVTKRFI